MILYHVLIISMNNQEEFEWDLQCELNDILSRMWSDFWNHFFCKIIAEHSNVSGLFVMYSAQVKFKDVVDYLMDIINDLAHIYGFRVLSNIETKEAYINLDFFTGLRNDDFNIEINEHTLFIGILCHNININFRIEDYALVGHILKDFCYRLFTEQIEKGKRLKEDFAKIENEIKSLSFKTIQIAKNSIKCLYDSLDDDNKKIVQTYVHSSIIYKGNVYTVLHNEFLKNPDILVNQLKSHPEVLEKI